MATIKSYTDIEQSKKLAKILPLESADMCWTKHIDNGDVTSLHATVNYGIVAIDYPCWSLAALLSIFECYEINKFGNNIQFDAKGIALSTKENETILDIVVDTIILLHKQNLL